jgi:hypothetical protein
LLGCWIAIVDCTHVIHKLKHSRYLLLIVPYVMTSYVCDGWWVMWLVWLPLCARVDKCCVTHGWFSCLLLCLTARQNVHLVTATDSLVMCETASLIVHHHDLHLLGNCKLDCTSSWLTSTW